MYALRLALSLAQKNRQQAVFMALTLAFSSHEQESLLSVLTSRTGSAI